MSVNSKYVTNIKITLFKRINLLFTKIANIYIQLINTDKLYFNYEINHASLNITRL